MFFWPVLFSLFFCLYQCVLAKRASQYHNAEQSDETDLGLGLIASLRDDANLDLSVDEEYEDLRAELLAYQAALASVVSSSRRALVTTPCWQAGGICINYKLCKGAQNVAEVAGCRDKHNVCCFAWNRYFVKDYRDKGIPNIAMPWITGTREFGGKGIQLPKSKSKKGNKKLKKNLKKGKKKIDKSAEVPIEGIIFN